ncbi:MAG: DUF3795 domain-containing protein [Anaerolineae bacterium]|nr:DUF3795 domain-containing protein [Anaerolineae bacterium]
MRGIIAYCGLTCYDCPSYVAHRDNDLQALQELAERTQREFGIEATPDSVRCEGCQGETGLKIGYCAECEIRACGVARGVIHCGACEDYACEKLEAFFAMAPEAHETLEAYRRSRPPS